MDFLRGSTLPVASSVASNLLSACSLLFGPDVHVSLDFVKIIELPALKAQYRKKAFEFHPDRAKFLGVNEIELSEKFKELTQAYETVNSAIEKGLGNNWGDLRRPSRARPPRPENPGNGFSHRTYKGPLPQRELLIGQFLYYTGIISWQTLMEAIIWQRRQRPLFGQIAVEWGILTPADVVRILDERRIERRFREKFGEFALNKHYITPYQRLAILGKQRKQQRLIGEFFIDEGYLSPREMATLIERLKAHNLRSGMNPYRFYTGR